MEQTLSNWDAIWMITSIILTVILAAFWAIFKDDLENTEAPAAVVAE